jgi:hypothetical protein
MIQAHITANESRGGNGGGGFGASEGKNLNASHIARKKCEFSQRIIERLRVPNSAFTLITVCNIQKQNETPGTENISCNTEGNIDTH